MQISVSTYSYNRLLKSGKLNELDVLDDLKQKGFEFVEFSELNIPEGENKISYASKLRDKCDRLGIKISNYAVSADFLACDDWKREVEMLKQDIKAARIFGVKHMRHDASWGFPEDFKGKRSFDDALPILTQGCRAVTEYAEEYGIRTMVENHGFFCQDSVRIEKLINSVDHKNFGVLADIGNFMVIDEDPGVALGRLAPYVFYVHVKDFHKKSGQSPYPGREWFLTRGGNFLRKAILGHGDVPVQKCLNILKKEKYEGVLAIEFEGMENPYDAIDICLENLKRYLNN